MTVSIKSSMEPILWLMLMLTGILLAVLLPVHVYLTHLTGADVMSFDAVLGRLSSAPTKLFYFVVLLALVFHGWGGVRGILFDIEGLRQHRQKIDASILIVSLITVLYGSYLVFALGK
jgi:succinate dehydrogenase / fumarate reductase membrane anchor subunit